MLRTWEQFELGPFESGSELHVTINAKGEIMIGANAWARLNRPEHAVLLYDRVNCLIGIQAATGVAKGAFRLNGKPSENHRVIRANRFCRYYNIQADRTLAFDTPTLDPDGTLVLDLKATTPISRRK